ncbi:MAG: FAD-dependent oxidoreductase [Halioglobus sp.]
MSGQPIDIDIVILGGGIAGLWSLNQLRNQGYSAVLLESEALGSQQTIASQGMIHGGIKYALSGAWGGGSDAISTMPAAWRECLQGTGKVDLRGARILSEDFYMWSDGDLQSRLGSFFASKLLRGRIDKLQQSNFPAPLRNPGFNGQVYRLIDMVMDMPSVIETLASRQRDAIFRVDWSQSSLLQIDGNARIQLPGCELRPQRLLFTAGTGNEALIRELGGQSPQMQRRPLQQIIVKHDYPEPFYAHCIGGNPSPRLTISSHKTLDGDPVWYLGGDLATEHTAYSPEKLIALAQSELRQLLPWIDFGVSEWSTITLDRAEPKQSALLRPDRAFVGKVDSVGNTLACWPTKLSLSPDLANEIDRSLAKDNITPRFHPDMTLLQHLSRPGIAPTCWDTCFQ